LLTTDILDNPVCPVPVSTLDVLTTGAGHHSHVFDHIKSFTTNGQKATLSGLSNR